MKTLIRRAVWPLYLLVLAVYAGTEVVSYLDAAALWSRHTVVDAQLARVPSGTATGNSTAAGSYRYEYRYTVAGQEFTQPCAGTDGFGEDGEDAGTIRIAYDNEDPARSAALAVLQKQASLVATARRIVIAGSILGVLTFLVYAWADWQRRSRFGT